MASGQSYVQGQNYHAPKTCHQMHFFPGWAAQVASYSADRKTFFVVDVRNYIAVGGKVRGCIP